ncbi:MAG: hypothetical protein KDK75_02160 [Alphaproteobacteria bacterium]|nr:hypothetical protein [Alphaproteobacteria bacterium]
MVQTSQMPGTVYGTFNNTGGTGSAQRFNHFGHWEIVANEVVVANEKEERTMNAI